MSVHAAGRSVLCMHSTVFSGNAALESNSCLSCPVFSFPALPNEESLMGVSKPLPKQLWEAKKVSGEKGMSRRRITLHSQGNTTQPLKQLIM